MDVWKNVSINFNQGFYFYRAAAMQVRCSHERDVCLSLCPQKGAHKKQSDQLSYKSGFIMDPCFQFSDVWCGLWSIVFHLNFGLKLTHSSILSQSMRSSDGQTRQMHSFPIARPCLHCMQRGKNMLNIISHFSELVLNSF